VLRHSLNALSIHFALALPIISKLPSEARSALRVLGLLPGWGIMHKIKFDESSYWQRRAASLVQMTAL
jgi:hypothetical protein